MDVANVPETDKHLATHVRREEYPKSSSEVMNALKQDVGFDVDQSSNVKVLARTRRRTTAMKRLKPALPSNICFNSSQNHFVMHKDRDPQFHAVVVALVIIIVVCGMAVFAHFFVSR